MRVVTYNAHGFREGLERVVSVVRRLEPDVLLLNETGGRLALRRFARAVGMEAAADPWSPLRRRVKEAVLVRRPWTVAEHRLIRFADGSFLLPRGALVARLEREGRPLLAVATHLGLRPRERLRHARELIGLLAGSDADVVVGGDLNAEPGERTVQVFTTWGRDAWATAGEGDGDGDTFPAGHPTARIDYLFVSEGLRVERAWVLSDDEARGASDHLPLMAELSTSGRR